ncbi:MAG: hypothetical protein JZU67_03965, partial [Burkholderiaceae bacterium]|nr:hypothetical protein [Burkholderiaceae bacterium]
MGVDLDRFCVRQAFEPWKPDGFIRHFQRKFCDAEGFLYERCFAFHQSFQVFNRCIGKTVPWHFNSQTAGFLRLGIAACLHAALACRLEVVQSAKVCDKAKIILAFKH